MRLGHWKSPGIFGNLRVGMVNLGSLVALYCLLFLRCLGHLSLLSSVGSIGTEFCNMPRVRVECIAALKSCQLGCLEFGVEGSPHRKSF